MQGIIKPDSLNQIIKEGERGRFTQNGTLISIETIPDEEFKELILNNLSGHNPLPESNRIAKVAEKKNIGVKKFVGHSGVSFRRMLL